MGSSLPLNIPDVFLDSCQQSVVVQRNPVRICPPQYPLDMWEDHLRVFELLPLQYPGLITLVTVLYVTSTCRTPLL